MNTTGPPAAGDSLDLALLRGAVEELPLGVATTRGGAILYANSALERIYGARPGELDNQHIERLFDGETVLAVRAALDTQRVFDGRVPVRGLEGRTITAEIHAERYKSASGAIGGFLLVRDATLELGALARLVDMLGGALFRFRVQDAVLEHVSPAIETLLGVTPAACVGDPRALAGLLESGERERISSLFRRLADGREAAASAEMTLRRPDGTKVPLAIHATGQRDAAGIVRHLDGVVTVARVAVAPVSPPPRAAGDDAAKALLLLAGQLLREVGFLTHAGTTTARRVRGATEALRAASVPGAAAAATQELWNAGNNLLRALGAASALNRRVRRALDGRITRGALVDVLENVRSSLAPLVGEHAITMEPGNGGRAVYEGLLDTLTLTLTHLGLRAFRLAGSGSLRLEARREGGDILIDIVGEPGLETTVAGGEPDSGSLPAATVPGDTEALNRAVATLLATLGGTLDEDVSLNVARSRVRLRAP